MTDDALRVAWSGGHSTSKEALMTAMSRVFDDYESAQGKDRRVTRIAVALEAVLFPALVWCAAYGRTPLVRGGYALMAVGTGAMLFVVWLDRTWSRHALPGPADARSQLQKTGFLLARQANLLRAMPLWCTPVFVGAMMIGQWLYRERSHGGGYLLWTTIAAAWLASALGGMVKARQLDALRSRIDRLLNDL
jgi:hypothetical protein